MELGEQNFASLQKNLNDTFSLDDNLRKKAESYLESLEVFENYPMLLLNLLTKDNVDKTILLACAITFKNYIKRNWNTDEDANDWISSNNRLAIKENIVNTMVMSPKMIQNQLSDAVSIIGKYDFPTKWPNLITEMVDKFQTDQDTLQNEIKNLKTINENLLTDLDRKDKLMNAVRNGLSHLQEGIRNLKRGKKSTGHQTPDQNGELEVLQARRHVAEEELTGIRGLLSQRDGAVHKGVPLADLNSNLLESCAMNVQEELEEKFLDEAEQLLTRLDQMLEHEQTSCRPADQAPEEHTLHLAELNKELQPQKEADASCFALEAPSREMNTGDPGNAAAVEAELVEAETRSQENQDVAPSKKFRCKVCGSKYKHLCQLKIHCQSTHFEEKAFMCISCGTGFSLNQGLAAHLKSICHKQKCAELGINPKNTIKVDEQLLSDIAKKVSAMVEILIP